MPISSRKTASTFAARVGVSCWRLYSCHWTSACGAKSKMNVTITMHCIKELDRQQEWLTSAPGPQALMTAEARICVPQRSALACLAPALVTVMSSLASDLPSA